MDCGTTDGPSSSVFSFSESVKKATALTSFPPEMGYEIICYGLALVLPQIGKDLPHFILSAMLRVYVNLLSSMVQT